MDNTEIARLAFDVTCPFQSHVSSEKTPIFLLHGMTSTKETWSMIKQDLADKTGRKVYSLDARNHGDSEWREDCSYAAMARDVISFMDKMSIPSAIFMGHSMGGKTAMVIATTEPDKVEKLIAEDISPKPLLPNSLRYPYFYLKLLRKCLEIIPPSLDLDSAKKVAWKYIYDNTPEEHRSTNETGQKHASSTLALAKSSTDGFSWKINIDALEKLVYSGPPRTKAVTGVYNGPTLCICGTKSVYEVMKDKDCILEHFPKASFVEIEGATHLVHYEFPEEFLQAVVKFMEEQPSSSES